MSETISTEAIAVQDVRPRQLFVGHSGIIYVIRARNLYENGSVAVEFSMPGDDDSWASMTFTDPKTTLNIIK